jgi:RNA polymerase sigma factor (sigma-70 family)
MAPALAQRPRTDRAFERLYRRHVADVYRYSLAVLRNPADAEDVTQTTFLNAYRAFSRGERPDAAHNWLIKIAHNVCRQRFRTSSRRPYEVAFEEDLAATLVEENDGPTAEDIRRGLGQLAFNQRAALVARELEGRSYAEIGEILGLSVGAVETLIFRARRALREQLEGSLTCHEAEAAISRQLDGRLARSDKGTLRAHLRECGECATFARRLRAQRTALKALAAVPIPGSLASFFGGTTVGSGVAALKVGAIAATFVAAGAVTTVGEKHAPWHHRAAHVATAAASPAPAAPQVFSLRTGVVSSAPARPAPVFVARQTRRAAAAPAARSAARQEESRSKSSEQESRSQSSGRSNGDEQRSETRKPAAKRTRGDSGNDNRDQQVAAKKQGESGGKGGGGSPGAEGDKHGDGGGDGGHGGGKDGKGLPDLGLPQAPVDPSGLLP